MSNQRILTQAFIGGILYLLISLILENSLSSETFISEGGEALIFTVIYGIGLWVYHRFIKKKN